MTTDTYPDDYDHPAWLTCPPPAQLGPGLCGLINEVRAWNETKKDQVNDLFQAACTDAYEEVWADVNEVVYDHPIGAPAACTEITTVEPWTDAISAMVGDGPTAVINAVAARDHDLISADDFALLTGWWVEAGLPLPDRISDTDRAALVEWWAEDGVYLPTPA